MREKPSDAWMQGFSYGLLDTLNKHFQNTLGISKARSSGLQAAYFGLCSDAAQGSNPYLTKMSRSLPSCFPGTCELFASICWLQSSFHLGSLSLRYRCSDRLAMPSPPLFWGFLCRHLHHWQRSWLARNCSKSLPSRYKDTQSHILCY